MKRVHVQEDVCIGCRLCEIYCLVEHSRTKDLIKAFKKEPTRPLPRLLVEEEGPTSFALQCRHCPEPDCVYACISGAMEKDASGVVKHNPDKCVGCWSCIMACPLGVIRRDERVKRVASKCDLCVEREEPACVANCPNQALKVVEE